METVLIVHGTFANNASWWKPGGEFCDRLDAALSRKKSNARCWAHLADDNDVSYVTQHFFWSGENSAASRIAAADEFREYLSALTLNPKINRIHIVAHSHGGNVVLDAISHYGGNYDEFGSVITLGTPYIRRRLPQPSEATEGLLALACFAVASWFVLPILSKNYLIALASVLLLIFGSGLCVGAMSIIYKILIRDVFLPTPASRHRTLDRPRVTYAISSSYDEAISLLNICLESLKASSEIAAHVVDIKWDTLFTKSWIGFRTKEKFSFPRYGTGFEAFRVSDLVWGTFDILVEILADLLKLTRVVIFKLPLSLLDQTLGRLSSFLKGLLSRIVVRQGIIVAAKRALGVDITGLHIEEVAAYTNQGHSVHFQPTEALESEILDRVSTQAPDTVKGIYELLANNPVSFDAKDRVVDVFTNVDLVHASYYQEDEFIELIASLISENVYDREKARFSPTFHVHGADTEKRGDWKWTFT